ncbi:hypothetical protein DRP53_02565 [candidate division WOR-3 bacterium]|uniref:Uncharacterized protein n=1 Tax=candidate division WOR-3 bacterium TaxID=2052148 RepID=A0A660SK51_UNCW3|nr:MAG: hypothetical protein DRP53_02565 [candidate division WOR-3 bacterium]
MIGLLIFLSLSNEIRIINLLNGLELDRAQKERIIALATSAQKLHREYESEKEGLEAEIEPLLQELKEVLIEHDPIPSHLRKSIHRVEEKLIRLRAEYHSRLDSLAQLLTECLRPEQIYVIETYQPCLIPPPGEAKIGQSEKPLGIYHLLDRIRKMPEPVYQRNRDRIIERVAERIVLHAPPWQKLDQKLLKREIGKIFDRTRSLTPLEYSIQREELAEYLKGFTHRPGSDLEPKIRKFLLSEEVIDLLKRSSQ